MQILYLIAKVIWSRPFSAAINTLIIVGRRSEYKMRRKISFIIHRHLLFVGLNARFIFTISSGQGKSSINLRDAKRKYTSHSWFLRRRTVWLSTCYPLTFFTLHILPPDCPLCPRHFRGLSASRGKNLYASASTCILDKGKIDGKLNKNNKTSLITFLNKHLKKILNGIMGFQITFISE